MERRVMSFVNHYPHISLQMERRWRMHHHSGSVINTFNFFIRYASAYSYDASAMSLPAMQLPLPRTHSHTPTLGLLVYHYRISVTEMEGSVLAVETHIDPFPAVWAQTRWLRAKKNKNGGKIVAKVKRTKCWAVLTTLSTENQTQDYALQSLFLSESSSLLVSFFPIIFSSPRLHNLLQLHQQPAIFTSTNFLISLPISGVSFSLLTSFFPTISSQSKP